MEDKKSRNTTIHERIKMLVAAFADGKNTVFAQRLGVSEANIRSYIRGVVPKADVLENIVISYEVNAMWLLTGIGNMSIPNRIEVAVPLTTDMRLKEFFNQMEPFLRGKDDQIVQQAEEIGRLKEQNSRLERENMELRAISNRNISPQLIQQVFPETELEQKV